jgi:Zn-dependent metalloprotease
MLLVVVLSFSAAAQTSANEKAAREWISSNSKELGIKDFHTFKLNFVRKSLSGETLRFQQMVNDVPVFKSEIVVHFSPQNKISSTSNSYDAQVKAITTTPSISKEDAISKSNRELEINSPISFQECKLYVYNKLPETKLVYRVVTDSELKTGSWETVVDAQTGVVLSKKDVAVYHKEKSKKKEKTANTPQKNNAILPAFVTGNGMIFDPDPLSFAHVAYGGTYTDASDAANASLDAARTSVVLPELEFTAGVYKLKSSYVEIKNLGAPNKGLFTQATADFNFNRNQDGFEAVNCYYHIDKSLRYINETLGIPCRPLGNGGILWFDPSSVDGDDNSFYDNGQLNFGEGGVDDGEDADVILHELGHGIHDWVTNGELSQEDGLSEGFGDYWAMSYSRSLHQWQTANAAYHYVFSWDGHNPFWDGRVTNTSKTYPSGLDGEVHDDGEIWAAASMKIYDQLGRAKTDTVILEGLSTTNANTNQQQAAVAVRQAAIDLNYSCADVNTITTLFTARGYSMPAFPVSINCPDTQTVSIPAESTYAVPSFADLSNAISQNCNAIVTQTPEVGTALVPGTYQVTMTATNGTVAICSFTLQVIGLLGVSENELAKNSIVVYPNPVSNMLTVKGKFDANESIIVYNLLGQKVIEKQINSAEEKIDVSKLANGIYSIYFNTAKVTHKFVKK